jgi:lysophospholipase L1-like esterase
MNWETLICFGDSITAGARSYLGYPEYTGSMLSGALKKEWNIINYSANGLTTIGLVRSVNEKFYSLKSFDASMISVLIGTNDLKEKITETEFEIAYSQLIIKLKLICKDNHILLIKIPKLPAGVMYPYHFNMNEKIPRFNKVIESIANKHHLKLFEFDVSEEHFFDGVHLNETGSKIWGAQLAKFILQDKGLAG